MTQEGYDAAKQWLSKYDPEAFKAFAKETSQDGFTFVTFVNNRLKTCPLCLGDCDAANPLFSIAPCVTSISTPLTRNDWLPSPL